MGFIKGFFSKIFTSQTETKEVPETAETNDALKVAAREAVMSALNPKKESGASTPQNTEKVKNRSIEEKDSINFHHPRIKEILNEYNENFFRSFKIDKSQYRLKLDNNNMIVQVKHQDFADALAQSNKLSLAYEHIFLRLVQKEFKHFEYRLSLQSGDSQNQHQKNIKALAHKLANRVKKTGQKVTIPAKSSYERCIIHQVVAKFPGLASKSIGPHNQRRLIIYSTQTRAPSNKHTSQNVHK